MNANDFVSQWGIVLSRERAKAEAAGVPEIVDDLKLVTAPRKLLAASSFPSDAARFLVEAGLPRSCAPFLSFEAVGRGPLPLAQHYGVHQFKPPDLSRLSSLHVIGSDGAGNPLCLDSARGGEIVMLDHEDGFHTRIFVASSVFALAEALLLVHTVPHKDFVEHLRSCDPAAADESAFLPGEVATLIE
jgi:hypothetical protein